MNPGPHTKVTQSCPTLQPLGLYSPWNSPGQNIAVGSLSILQGIFPTQGLNPGLLHCRQILYQLSYKESPLVVFFFLCVCVYLFFFILFFFLLFVVNFVIH